ncbi:hypothetical protein ATM97_09960 [Nocardia sp. MH4]|uniref:AbiJ-NTD4 domain-containing protein n=1 Tax=Nocardia sp. MH4 TaxID=1768677 RepID=UPI001C4FBEDA|nr:hypothetical protein [Nocardia sp. MH4]MBW0275517.1 hypothetical protein [Nocardia sp. MH4]
MIWGVADQDFYSDRVQGPKPRDRDELSEDTRNGLINVVIGLINEHWFAERFPEECPDGNNICGTLTGNLLTDIRALIPGIPLQQLNADHMSDMQAFDLLEYAYQHISKPKRVKEHGYYKHWELSFDRKSALSEFRKRVNLILSRGRANYEMDTDGRIVRIGSAPVRRLVQKLRPDTGDEDLDDLIRNALEFYTSKDPQQRQAGLEKLWDGYERLKSVSDPDRKPDKKPDKRRGIAALIEVIKPPELRALVEAEMRTLTDIGNQFQIRHFESDTHPIPDFARDYVFTRLGDLLMWILAENGLLSDDPDN